MVTSHDVARAAGVSQATVSRALRGMPEISETTIAHVRAVADDLGYVLSEAGRTLATRWTNCIGIVAAELTNPFYPQLVEPLRAELRQQGYRTLLIPDSTEAPLHASQLADGTLDGVILMTALTTSKLPGELARRDIPLVMVNRTVDGVTADSCTFDNAAGAAAAARLLAALGHRRVGVISGPTHMSTGRDRERAFLDEAGRLGIEVPPPLQARGPFAFTTGFQATVDFLEVAERPTALFCGNDVIALGACNALAERGLSQRRDVAVVGFDDIAMAAWPLHDLTTLRCDMQAMARESVRLVLRRIRDRRAENEAVVLVPDLVERSSTWPL